MDDRPADVSTLAKLEGGLSKEEYASLLAELAEQLDEQEYEAFWDEMQGQRRSAESLPIPKPK